MTEELRKAIADYFDPCEFVEFIGVTVAEMIDTFEDKVDEALPDLLEIMEYEESSEEDG